MNEPEMLPRGSSEKPNSDSPDPINPDLSPTQDPAAPTPLQQPHPQLLSSLPNARTFHREQYARLQQALQRVAVPDAEFLGPPDPPAPEDPKEKLERLEKQAQQVAQELQEAQVEMARTELLVSLAPLDLKDLKALKQALTTKGWLQKLRNTFTST